MAAILFLGVGYIGYMSISTAALKAERSANAMVESKIKLSYALWELDGKSAAQYNSLDQAGRKAAMLDMTAGTWLNEGSDKRFKRILMASELPRFGEAIGLNTEMPTGIWAEQRTPSKSSSLIIMALTVILATHALRPKKQQS